MIGPASLSLFSPSNEWAIQPDVLLEIHNGFKEEARFQFDKNWNLKDTPIASNQDGICTVSVTGPLMRSPSRFMEAYYGATDFEEIAESVTAAAKDPSVRGIFLDIDSPGGTVNGTPECAQAIIEAKAIKPVYAFTSGLMASAAYWLGSQATKVYCTPSSIVGSIGVIVSFLDVKGALDSMGLKMEVFAAGKFKAAGLPGTSLTDEQRENFKSRVEATYKDFKAAVLSSGRLIPDSAMEGQTFYGKEAEKLNLAGVVKNRAEAMSRLQTFARSRSRN